MATNLAQKPTASADVHVPASLESVVIRFAGDSGDGMQLTGTQFTHSTALMGTDLATFPDFPAEIRAPTGTTFGVSAYQINFGARRVLTAGDQPDVLVAMNPAALKTNLVQRQDAGQGGLLVEPARGRQRGAVSGHPARHLQDDAGIGQGIRPLQQGGHALQEHVDAWPDAVDVRPPAPVGR
jgi:2-oxoglutarate ferredoxin oxidoreductase subunit alpha